MTFKTYCVETTLQVKRQYLIYAADGTDALDQIEMKEVQPIREMELSEHPISIQILENSDAGHINIRKKVQIEGL